MRDHPLALVTVSGVLGTAVAIGMGFAIPSDRASVCVDGQRAGSTGNFIADTGDRILLATTAHDKRIVSFNADEVWKVRYGLQGRLACRRANPAPVR